MDDFLPDFLVILSVATTPHPAWSFRDFRAFRVN